MERLHLVPPTTTKEKLLGCTVGIRPYRVGGPRLECEKINNKIVFHDYGHGGAGVSIGYGCVKYIVTKFVKEFGVEKKNVAVIGSGYIGLFTAILLAELGYNVTIYAEDFPVNFGVYKDRPVLTSQVAGGLWMPYGYDINNRALHDIFSKDTFEFYQRCISSGFYKGLSYKKMILYGPTPNLVKLYVPEGIMKDYREVEITFGNGSYFPARVATTILMDGDIFLNELVKEAKIKDVKFTSKKFKTLEDLKKLDEEIIFNCTGNGAATLFADKNMKPIKGQLIYFEKPNGFDYFLQALSPNGERITTYPQGNKQAIGLSYEENVTNIEPDPKILETLRKNMEDFLIDKIARPKL